MGLAEATLIETFFRKKAASQNGNEENPFFKKLIGFGRNRYDGLVFEGKRAKFPSGTSSAKVLQLIEKDGEILKKYPELQFPVTLILSNMGIESKQEKFREILFLGMITKTEPLDEAANSLRGKGGMLRLLSTPGISLSEKAKKTLFSRLKMGGYCSPGEENVFWKAIEALRELKKPRGLPNPAFESEMVKTIANSKLFKEEMLRQALECVGEATEQQIVEGLGDRSLSKALEKGLLHDPGAKQYAENKLKKDKTSINPELLKDEEDLTNTDDD